MRPPKSPKNPSDKKRESVPSSVPSREALIEHIKGSKTTPSKREIARAFGIRGGPQKIALKKLLRHLTQDGLYGEPGKENIKSFAPEPAALPPSGFRKERVDPCAVGSCLVGVIRDTEQGAKFVPTTRQTRQIFSIKDVRSISNKDRGRVLQARVTKESPPVVAIESVVGDTNEISLISAAMLELPTDFSPEALRQTETFSVPKLDKRDDVRSIPLVTIDGVDSRDFDDAVWAEPFDENGKKGWHMIVAIADVSYYVRRDTPLNRDALERGTSVYFPDRVIPMLPEVLSNNLCSLRPDEDRACVGAHIWIDENGHKIRHKFFRGLMRSAARLTYEQAQMIQDSPAPHPHKQNITHLYGAYQALDRWRRERGTLEIDLPEPYIVMDPAGNVESIDVRQRLDSHRLIEEFMVTANVAAAEFLKEHRVPCLYRVHDKPDPDKVENLRRVLHQLKVDYKAPLKTPGDFTKLLHFAKESPHAGIINELILRCQSQAVYTPDNIGHFGLNLTHYCHFTSPIRRYPDLLVHRGIVGMLGYEDGLGAVTHDQMEVLGQETSFKERRADSAQRDATDRFMTQYLLPRVGEAFEVYVSGISKAGLFVTLPGIGTSGLIPMHTLGDDYYNLLENPSRLEGRRTRKVYALGDNLTVKLTEADVIKGRLAFEIQRKEGDQPRPNFKRPFGRRRR